MKVFQIVSDGGIDAIELTERPEPSPGPGEVVVGLRAASLNYRDVMIASGGYPLNDTRPVIPLSDGAGEVVAVGAGVNRWKPGDRVMASFMRDWIAGPMNGRALTASLGGGVDGVLAERFVMPAHALVRIPSHLGFDEASTLPCAALVAWNGLISSGTKAGDQVLIIGAGGVATFGVQLARTLGAVPIIASVNDQNFEDLRALGAAHTINGETHPEWHEEVIRITDGQGVDHVLESGGPGTLGKSILSTRVGGTITLIGVVAQGAPPPLDMAMFKCLTLRGVSVGSVEMLESMSRAIEASGLKPVIGERFEFDGAIEAYRAFVNRRRFGKIVITCGS